MRDKLNIEIRIGDQDPFPLIVNFDDEKYARSAEEGINYLWVKWKEKFKLEPDRLMAMIAFRYAQLYAMQKEREQLALHSLDEFEKKIAELTDAIEGTDKKQPKTDPKAPGAADHPSLL